MYDILISKVKNKYLVISIITISSILVSTFLSVRAQFEGGILIIALSMIPLVQIYTKIIEKDEKIAERIHKDENILFRYKDFIIYSFVILFSSIFAFYIAYLINNNLFFLQLQAINDIKEHVSVLSYGNAINTNNLFSYIILNNLVVLVLFFLFSIIYGAGAIYLLLWNASIIGVFLGIEASGIESSNLLFKYIIYPLYKLFLLLPHGILEFLAYFLAALSGSILSIAFIKGLPRKVLERVISDALALFILSVFMLFVAAFIEVYL
ncbi:MAG: stage II sporulation protein M [Nanopusillaceae archaeon]